MADPAVFLPILREAASRHQAGRLAEAEPLYRQVLAIEPKHADSLNLLGLICHQTHRPAEAEDLIRRALAVSPGNANYLSNLGMVLAAQGRLNEAIQTYRGALSIRPEPGTLFNLGNALHLAGDLPAAIEAFQKALVLRPLWIEALNNLGLALHDAGRLDEATAAYRQGLGKGPDAAQLLKNLGNAMRDAGELDEAIRCYQRAADLGGDARAAGNLLYTLHFHPRFGPREIREAHARWNDRFCRPFASTIQPHTNDRSPDRLLRIGYVSPDLHAHPVGRFLLPLFAHHDRSQFKIYCFSDLRQKDAVTAQLRANTDVWRDTATLSDAELAQTIRADSIDILVDLTMHMKGNRLLVFARKPAPVQVTYLAYCSTTGVEAIDYRISDIYLDPHVWEGEAPAAWEGEAPAEPQPHKPEKRGSAGASPSRMTSPSDSPYVEKTIRLPRTYWCYQPHYESLPVAPPPSQRTSSITFGCLNTYSKINPDVWATWSAIVKNVPGSRLIVHSLPGAHRDRDRELLQSLGVDPTRLQFVGFLRGEEYFHHYDQIDIALDPFPYPGGTTTCDALWMGVPVVSLAGQTAVSRAGLSILSNVGLSELIARTTGQYIEIATALASDVSRLTALRASLRERMKSSPLMDAPQFARDVETAYRQMWQRFCDSRATGP